MLSYYGNGLIYYFIAAVVITVCLLLERNKKNKDKKRRSNRPRSNRADKDLDGSGGSNSGGGVFSDDSGNGSGNDGSACDGGESGSQIGSVQRVHVSEAAAQLANADEKKSNVKTTVKTSSANKKNSWHNDADTPAVTHSVLSRQKNIRITAVAAASVCMLAAFTAASFALFQSKTALFFVEQKLDAAYNQKTAAAYFAVSAVCAALIAASAVLTFLRWRNIFKMKYFGSGFILLAFAAAATLLFIVFYCSYNLKGVTVMSALLAAACIAFTAVTFFSPPETE